MKLISHRGNIDGKNPEKENHPDYIWAAIQAGYDVEIDVWFKDNKFMLGHDEPQYEFPFELMQNHYSKLWLHCKNLEALEQLSTLDSTGRFFNYFWHEEDTVTLTSILDHIKAPNVIKYNIKISTFDEEKVQEERENEMENIQQQLKIKDEQSTFPLIPLG